MLDLLHHAKAATLRGAGTRHGGGRFLAGGINGENRLGEIRIFEAPAGSGWAGSGFIFDRVATRSSEEISSVRVRRIRDIHPIQ